MENVFTVFIFLFALVAAGAVAAWWNFSDGINFQLRCLIEVINELNKKINSTSNLEGGNDDDAKRKPV